MSDDPGRSEPSPALSAAAAAEWIGLVGSVLRGIAHGLNNRGAALAALAELTSDPAEHASVLHEILAAEQLRVRELAHAVRMISEWRGAAEALLPADVIGDVSVVLAHHPDLRDGAVQIEADQGSPIRVPRWAFVRALLAVAAYLTGGTRANPRRIVITTEGDWLVITADHPAHTASRLAIELAHLMGGDALDGRYGIRLPTLAALRRREGR